MKKIICKKSDQKDLQKKLTVGHILLKKSGLITMERHAEELFLREELVRSEMALEQEQIGKNQLIKRLSEDIKKPVEQLIQFTELALLRIKRNERETAISYLAKMRVIEEDLLLHLNDLRELALIKSGESKFHLIEIDLKSILKKIQKKFQPIVENAGGQLIFYMSASVPYVIGDEHKLIKVMTIILSHIMEKIEKDDVVKIKVMSLGTNLEIHIIDSRTHYFDKKTRDQLYFGFDSKENKGYFPNFNLTVSRELMAGQRGRFLIESFAEETHFILGLPISKEF